MKGLISFENTRFWRSTKNIIVLLAYVAVLIGLIVYNSSLDKSYWNNQQGVLIYERGSINNIITEVQSRTATIEDLNPDDTETLAELEREYDYYRSQYLYNYQQHALARQHTPERNVERIDLDLQRDRHMLKGMEQGYEFFDQTKEEVLQRIAINEYILEQKLLPLNSPHEMTATNFLTQLLDYPWILAILIAIALLTIDIFSGDVEGGAYKNLYAQPIFRGRIYAAKYLVRFFYSFLIISGLTALVFAVLIPINGLGSVDYPQGFFLESFQSRDTTGALTFLPWSQYILRTIPLYCLLCLFVMLLIGTASLLLKNTGNALNASFCILVLDFLARTLFAPDSKFYTFWPLSAAGINGVLQGIYRSSALAYLILLGLSVIILYVGGALILRKQDLTVGMGS